MEYKGKLYAKIANKYLEISHTDEFEKLESKVSKHVELSFELDGTISDLNKKHVTEITSRNKRINDLETELTELKEIYSRLSCINGQKITKSAIDLAFSIGYDAGYENGRKPTAPQNTEAPRVKD